MKRRREMRENLNILPIQFKRYQKIRATYTSAKFNHTKPQTKAPQPVTQIPIAFKLCYTSTLQVGIQNDLQPAEEEPSMPLIPHLKNAESHICMFITQTQKTLYIQLKFTFNFILQKIMAVSNNSLRSKRLNDIRTTFKQVPLIKKLASRVQLPNQSTFSNTSIKDHNYQYEKQTNSTPSEINTSSAIYNSKLLYNGFDDKYELFEKLGEGANGCVYRCQHKINKKIFAVKKFKVSEEVLLQTKRNFIHIQKLNHVNICLYKALYFDNDQRFAYLVMEYFPHHTLETYTVKSQQEIKLIVKQIVSAVRYLHQHQICHRDLKPENILFDQNSGKVKIIDFGISKKTVVKGVKRDMLTIIGTNFYFAPEIYLGGGYDERVDLWALGVTIYKLIAGYTPFQSEYQANTIKNILKGKIQFDGKVWDKYSPFARDFVCRTLKPKSQRLSAAQCQMHFWLQLEKQKKPKNRNRFSSCQLLLDEGLQSQLKNVEKAKSIEGQRSNIHKGTLRKIKSINTHEFDLQESEDEQLSCLKIKSIRHRQITI